jgi:hypothetical protein
MEGSFSIGQSPQWAVVPVEEEEELKDDEIRVMRFTYGGGEKYKSLTGKRGKKRDTGLQSISTL